MKSTWRWFGPKDIVSIDWMMQAGVEGVVSALHHVPAGEVWHDGEIRLRQQQIAQRKDGSASGLSWDVVESLPVSEEIKTQRGDWRTHIANWCESLEALSRHGIQTICYNFMPVLDWTRTDLTYRLPHGGTAMRFDAIDFAAFDIHILKRKGAGEGLTDVVRSEAQRRFLAMSDQDCVELTARLVRGLPGAVGDLTPDQFGEALDAYASINADQLRKHYSDFLEMVVPTAERLSMRLCCHPDDPPFPLLGLPRIMSTEQDYSTIITSVDSPANGITLCSGSLGARVDNDLPGMMSRLGSKVHFLHLRNVKRDSDEQGASFTEAEHLGGDTDMPALLAACLAEEKHRKASGRSDWEIPFRPDHGHDILDDLTRQTQPGYPAIGRLRGLAELRGVLAGLEHGG